jgi:hypothetical protein
MFLRGNVAVFLNIPITEYLSARIAAHAVRQNSNRREQVVARFNRL